MTHQRNLILQAAVAAAFGLTAVGAHAGTGSAQPANIATAALKDDTILVVGNSVSYSTAKPLSPNTTYFLYVVLSTTNGGGTAPKFADTPLPANVFVAGASNNASMSNMLQQSTVTMSADNTYAVYTLAVATGSAIPVNTTVTFTPAGAAQSGEANTLSGVATTPGATMNATISIGTALVTSPGGALQDIDSASGGPIVTFSAPQNYLALASSAFSAGGCFGGASEKAVIDVQGGTGISLINQVNTGAGSKLIDFGGFKFTDVGGVLSANQSTSWTMNNEYTGGSLGATLTGAFAASADLFTSSARDCSASINAFSLNAGKTIGTIAGGSALATGVPEFVCMLVDGKTIIPPTTPTLVTSLKPSVGAYAPGATLNYPLVGSVALYALGANGGTAVVRSYLPVAAAPYTSFIRIINIGSNAAVISVAVQDPVTGLISSPSGSLASVTQSPAGAAVAGSLAAGGAALYSSSQIEAALAAAGYTPTMPGNFHPRLVFTASTAIEAQHYVANPGGLLSTLHSKD